MAIVKQLNNRIWESVGERFRLKRTEDKSQARNLAGVTKSNNYGYPLGTNIEDPNVASFFPTSNIDAVAKPNVDSTVAYAALSGKPGTIYMCDIEPTKVTGATEEEVIISAPMTKLYYLNPNSEPNKEELCSITIPKFNTTSLKDTVIKLRDSMVYSKAVFEYMQILLSTSVDIKNVVEQQAVNSRGIIPVMYGLEGANALSETDIRPVTGNKTLSYTDNSARREYIHEMNSHVYIQDRMFRDICDAKIASLNKLIELLDKGYKTIPKHIAAASELEAYGIERKNKIIEPLNNIVGTQNDEKNVKKYVSII